MSAKDDTEILPAGQAAHVPSPNGCAPRGALTTPRHRRENDRPAAEISPRFLTALLRALSVWPA